MLKQSSDDGNDDDDATPVIREMHRKLLRAMSDPNCFHDAVDRIAEAESGRGLEYEKEDGTTTHHDDDNDEDAADEKGDAVPLPLRIFAPDAEVVLPEAMTANQLFGIERVTGIELEAAAGIKGLSLLFLRWLGECFIYYAVYFIGFGFVLVCLFFGCLECFGVALDVGPFIMSACYYCEMCYCLHYSVYP